jgi:hypothetical protein
LQSRRRRMVRRCRGSAKLRALLGRTKMLSRTSVSWMDALGFASTDIWVFVAL